LQTSETKGRKGAVVITLIIIVLVAAGVFWYMQSQNDGNSNEGSSVNTGKLSENLKGIDAQDKQYKNITKLELLPSNDAAEKYQVLRPLENVAANSQNEQSATSGALTALQAYALGKNGTDGKTQYNASFFTYKLAGEIASKSTDQIVKTQLDSAMQQAKQNPQATNATVEVGQAQKNNNVSFKTDKGETVKLASSKFEQTFSNGQSQKKLLSVVAAAKFGDQLLFVNATFADDSQFANAPSLLQEMAGLITLKLSE